LSRLNIFGRDFLKGAKTIACQQIAAKLFGVKKCRLGRLFLLRRFSPLNRGKEQIDAYVVGAPGFWSCTSVHFVGFESAIGGDYRRGHRPSGAPEDGRSRPGVHQEPAKA
jgi:hypothetical protein